MREFEIVLPDGKVSKHYRPVDLPEHIAFIDRSMGADEFFVLYEMARKAAKSATASALCREGLMTSKDSCSLVECPAL
jgi:hypothetical protein